MKPGDVVYGKYREEWSECEILSIANVIKGILWWKETVEMALVKFRIQEWNFIFNRWDTPRYVIVERPVSELREIQ